ncbi:MAG: Lrp/AsnC family transcriptional regulator [Alphaproteobacteria bacterium]|nr:Lrp/AsnC family transcriptional regulator [Alphaproteobacteria bacterium]
MTELSTTDQRLIAALRANARAPVAALARQLGLARSTVQERIARLERDGVIAGYTVRLGAETLGRQIGAHVMISVDPKQNERVVASLKRIPAIRSLSAVSGTYDLIAVLGAETTAEIDAVLDQIGHMQGIDRTMSSIILSVKFER